MQPVRTLEEPDPVQQYGWRRARVRTYVGLGIVLLLVLVGYFGVYR